MVQEKNNLDEFESWRIEAKCTLEQLGFTIQFFDSPESMNLSKRIDFRSNSVVAQIAVWEHGDVFADAVYLPQDITMPIATLDAEKYELREILDSYLRQIVEHPLIRSAC